MLRIRHILTFMLVVIAPMTAHAEPPRFGIEGSVGQSVGLTSYLDNVRYVADDEVFLADELADAGLELALRFVFDELSVGAQLRWFNRQRVTLHHRGTEPLPDNRVRPDGSIDDSGIEYEAIDNQTTTVPDSSRGQLFMLSAEGEYRWYATRAGPVDVFFPIAGGLVMTHVEDPQREYEFGLTMNAGIGANVEVAAPISLFFTGRLAGVLTPTYGDQNDANRAAVATSGTTPESLFSTLMFMSFTAGIQFSVR